MGKTLSELGLRILSEIEETQISKTDLINKFGNWGGKQEKTLNDLQKRGVVKIEEGFIRLTYPDIRTVVKKLIYINNAFDDYLTVLPKKDFVPWGVLVFLFIDKVVQDLENSLTYSISGIKDELRKGIIWKVFKKVFETGYSDLNKIAELTNIYFNELEAVELDIAQIMPAVVRIEKIDGSKHLLFSRNVYTWKRRL